MHKSTISTGKEGPSGATAVLLPRIGLLNSIRETCAALGIGKTRLYEEKKAGRLRIIKSGRRSLVPGADIIAFAQREPRDVN